MSKSLLRPISVLALFFWAQSFALAACVDSIELDIHSVQCYGLRNGIIRVSAVFGGEKPFYYSIDGQAFSTNPLFDRLWPGVYTIYVRDASGCVKYWSATVPEPEDLVVRLIASADTVVAGEYVKLTAQISPDGIPLKSIDWRPPDMFTVADTLKQEVRLSETTDFAIEVRTPDGCLARDHLTVFVEKTNLYFPNVIKPGSNQDAYFTLYAGEGVLRIISLNIYSRGGGIVFERGDFLPNDPIRGWNGRWGDKPVQPGVYPWIAVVEYTDGRRKQFHGNVTVVN